MFKLNSITRPVSLSITALFASAPVVLFAQPAEAPPPTAVKAPDGSMIKKKSITAGAQYLSNKYKIDEAEAQKRIDLETEVARLSAQMRASGDSSYSGITIDHEPVYRITVSFSENKDANAFRASIAPSLRRYIHVRQVKRNQAAIEKGLDELLLALRPLDPTTFTIAFDERNSKYVVTHESDAASSQIKGLIPAGLGSDTIVKRSPVPKRQAAPVGLQSGDAIYGGYVHYDYQNPDYPGCTFSWPVQWGTKTGILTAGHCGKSNAARNYYDGANGHWVKLPAPTFIKHDPNTKYDYQFHETTGYQTGGWIYVANKNNRPGYGAYEWMNVHALLGYYDQKVGMVMCNAGRVTGFTCGEITNGWYTWNGAKGFIEYGKADAYSGNLSDPGDSGSPTFMTPDLMNNVYGYGIHVAGTAGNGCTIYNTCTAVSMPIDYVDDHYPLVVKLNAYISYN